MNLLDYLKERGYGWLLEKVVKYLPSLPDPSTVVVVPWERSLCRDNKRAYGCAWKEGGKWYVSFKSFHGPDMCTVLHELVHVAGGGEVEAYNYVYALMYAINNDLPPFDLLKLRHVRLKELESISKKLFGISLPELFVARGIIPYCINMDGSWKELPEDAIVECVLAEIFSGLVYNDPVSVKFFSELVKLAR